jgi:hypothetical protein
VVGDIKKGRYVYYRCSHRRSPCAERYVRQETLSDLLCERIAPHLRLRPGVEASLREAAEALVKGGGEGEEGQRHLLKRRQREIDQRLTVLLDLRLAGSVTDEQYLAKREELTREQLRLRDQLAMFELPAIDPRVAVDWFVTTCNTLDTVLMDGEDAEVRELLRIVGSNYRFGEGKVEFEPVEPFTLAAQAQNRPNWRAGQAEVRTLVAFFQTHQERLFAPPEGDVPLA